MTTLNLITDPLISVRHADGTRRMTLPQVFCALQADALDDFPALQPHQQHAWYAFLVQLAALVHHAQGALPTDAPGWTAALQTLGKAPAAWCLLVADRTQPAFMQPPVGTAKLGGCETTPDGLDVLVTSKNHDVKRERMQQAAPEHWIFALVNLQTMQGFLGRGNYGIARMNGGFGNRPCVGRAPSMRLGSRWQRDLRVLRDQRAALAQTYLFARTGGHALLWLTDWSGGESIGLDACDPFVIEICRRVRLVMSAAGIEAHTGPSPAARLAGKDRLGLVGDPWTPYEDGKSLTLNGEGFSYRRLHQLLFVGDLSPSPAMQQHPDDPDAMWLRCWAMVRGQGQTEGVHQRWVPLPAAVEAAWGDPAAFESLGEVSTDRVQHARQVRLQVLRPALMKLLKAGAKPNDHRGFLDGHEARLERWVDRHFFELLWRDFQVDADDRDHDWIRQLCAQAWQVLQAAIDATPMPAVQRYARIAAAEGMFYGCRKKQFSTVVFTPKKGAA